MEQAPGLTVGAAAPVPGGATAGEATAAGSGQAITYLRRAGFTHQDRVGPYQLFRLRPDADSRGWAG
jgi:hypothetical protein